MKNFSVRPVPGRAVSGRLAWGVVSLSLVAAVAGCSTSDAAAQGTASPSAQQAAPGAYGKNKLKSAMITKLGTARPMSSANAGTVGGLQDKLGLREQLKRIKTDKRSCLTAGPNLTAAKLRSVPASSVTLVDKKHGYMIGEVLFSTAPETMRAVLGRRIPKRCRKLTAQVGKKQVQISMRELPAPKVGDSARGMLMTVTSGQQVRNSRTVMFTTAKYGGSVSLTGAHGNQALLNKAVRAAFQTAQRKLG